jgi:nucleotide-binding universal stress UspA family protein
MWSRYHDLILCGLRNLFDPGVIETPPIELVHFVEEGVRPLVAVAARYREIQRVMIAYSGSTESAKSMKRFIQLRPWADTEVHLVTFDHDEEKARGRLSQAADYCRAHGVDPQLHHGSESPKTGLLEYATRIDADLIVLGNSARNFLLKRIFGETALYVVAHADRPLFLCQ